MANRGGWTRPLAYSAAYIVGGTTWILTSDWVVSFVTQDVGRIRQIQTLKGWAFVVVSGALLFFITEQGCRSFHRVKRKLERAERDYHWLIETSPDGVWILDGKGATTLVNPRLAEMLGVDPLRLLSEGVESFLDDAGRATSAQEFDRHRTDREATQFDLRFTRPDGREVWMRVSARTILSPAGEFGGALRMLSDITANMLVERSLDTALRTQRGLVNELNHRIRNNLATLLAMLDLTRSAAHDVDRFHALVRARVAAMAETHKLLAETNWRPVDADRLVRRVIAASLSDDQAQRTTVRGDPVPLPPLAARPMAAVLNELALGSGLHGALASPTGAASVRWEELRTDSGQVFRLVWEEQGAGDWRTAGEEHLSLARGIAASDLQGALEVSPTEDGLSMTLRFGLDELALRPTPA